MIEEEYGASKSAFNYAKGVEQPEKAIKAAKGLKIPHGTTIYFAVDYDPQQSEIENYVIDYFKGITDIFTREEFVYEIGKILDDNGVIWQTSELGKVDQGGGGTIAQYVANLNMDVIDCGVPVLSMHAPFEVTAKSDVYMAYKSYVAFYNNR